MDMPIYILMVFYPNSSLILMFNNELFVNNLLYIK
jgi:hypothetical protein